MPTGEMTPTGTLEFVWLELLTRCNLACVHCYAASGPHAPARSLPTARWQELIVQAYELGCREVQLTGGEPTLHPDAAALMEHASRLGFRTVELFTNATLLDDAWVERLACNGHRAAVSLYSHRPDVHDAVTKTAGSHGRTVRGIRRLVAAGVPVRVEMVALEANADDLAATRAFIRDELGVPATPKQDPVRPNGRGREQRAPIGTGSRRLAGGSRSFFRLAGDAGSGCGTPTARTRRTCWSGKLAIAPDGDAFPCIFSRDLRVGNVREASLAEVIGGARVTELWSLGLDDVPECRECDQKVECFDCRALPYSVEGDLRAKNPRCGYESPAHHLRQLARAQEDTFVRRSGLSVREIDGELVAVDSESGLVHLANESATILLAALERPRTLPELGRALEDAYEVDASIALRDARAALALFLSRGLVDRAQGP